MIDVFKSPKLRITAFLMGFAFIGRDQELHFETFLEYSFDVNMTPLLAVTLSYYGLSYNAAALPGNLFINNTINGLVETLAYTVLMFSMPFIGRRKLTSGTFLLGGVIILLCAILLEFANGRQSMLDAAQWLSFIGKFFVSGCFGLVVYDFGFKFH